MAINFKDLLYKGIKLKRNLSSSQYLNPIAERDKILEELSALLLTCVSKNRKDLCAFHKRMQKYKEYIFTFLFYDQVPPDNNASERAIRNVKVKQKISG
ncbi:hypothetical protein RCH18_001032 [Flavobacterium sp. PL11]|jgi:transposase|uniref:IS66 family transposase n=1 Tax=Flavobacterium sp. PL11 TaxID=3071717 RepID=UPI002E0C0E5A|nr:hypothetical protein [Flavobacterium sp. PL11]